jgi:hypothetical protein
VGVTGESLLLTGLPKESHDSVNSVIIDLFHTYFEVIIPAFLKFVFEKYSNQGLPKNKTNCPPYAMSNPNRKKMSARVKSIPRPHDTDKHVPDPQYHMHGDECSLFAVTAMVFVLEGLVADTTLEMAVCLQTAARLLIKWTLTFDEAAVLNRSLRKYAVLAESYLPFRVATLTLHLGTAHLQRQLDNTGAPANTMAFWIEGMLQVCRRKRNLFQPDNCTVTHAHPGQ